MADCALSMSNVISHIHLMSSPLCLPGPEDLKMDLTKKSGLTAGWGATGVTYTETLCGWTRGVTDLDSTSDVLKKIEAVRLMDFL